MFSTCPRLQVHISYIVVRALQLNRLFLYAFNTITAPIKASVKKSLSYVFFYNQSFASFFQSFLKFYLQTLPHTSCLPQRSAIHSILCSSFHPLFSCRYDYPFSFSNYISSLSSFSLINLALIRGKPIYFAPPKDPELKQHNLCLHRLPISTFLKLPAQCSAFTFPPCLVALPTKDAFCSV